MGYDAEGACHRTGEQHHQQHCQWMEAESESKEGTWGLEEKEESWEWEEREELRQIDLHGIVLQTISQTRFVLEVFIKGVSFLRKPRVNRHCH